MGNAHVTEFPHLTGIFVSAMEAAPHSVDEATLRSAEIEIRPDEFVALVKGRPLDLTVRELALLTALVERSGRIVSREELYRVVWGEDYRKADRSVDVSVGTLRHKLAKALPRRRYIHTHFGFGYRFAPDGQDAADRPV
jgi:DNA-binding response OmpR family regulator